MTFKISLKSFMIKILNLSKAHTYLLANVQFKAYLINSCTIFSKACIGFRTIIIASWLYDFQTFFQKKKCLPIFQ